MMDTPVFDFVNEYKNSQSVRLHMPGHKGCSFLGPEAFDITEVAGADALYEADGIIKKSEENASSLFGSRHTVYSAEGSSQSIRGMLYLAAMKRRKKKPVFVAARNVHKAFIYGAALIDAEVVFLPREVGDDLCTCTVSPETLRRTLIDLPETPAAVYITSPDYMGKQADIRSLSEVCESFGTWLLVDNAHGAYTHFLKTPSHPLDLGAHLCCDSAHKTLPVLTGGGYLHAAEKTGVSYKEMKQAMALFGSTSPSYLILSSLDLCNRYLSEDYAEKLAACVRRTNLLKDRLTKQGWTVLSGEPLKVTLKMPGEMKGTEAAERLRKNGIEGEFADPDHLVLMVTPEITDEDLFRVSEALGSVFGEVRSLPDFSILTADSCMSIRDAVFSPQTMIPVEESVGRICAAPAVSCPPAVPVVISGERITEEAVKIMTYYGIEEISVVQM